MASELEKQFEQTRKRLERLELRLADIVGGMPALLDGFEHGGYTPEAYGRVAHSRELLKFIDQDLLKLEHKHSERPEGQAPPHGFTWKP
jgi:hypothetical protein